MLIRLMYLVRTSDTRMNSRALVVLRGGAGVVLVLQVSRCSGARDANAAGRGRHRGSAQDVEW